MSGGLSGRVQVVVVGGGPVGMLVAAELAGLGVETVLFEEQCGVSERPRATVLHARAVQCLARRGHVPVGWGALGSGDAGGVFHYAGLQGLVVRVPEGEPVPVLRCPQVELERWFEGRARGAGARVLRGYRVSEMVQEGGGVRVGAVGPEGPISLVAGFVVGADGARSRVRAWAGIASETRPATVSALMGVVRLADPEVLSDGWHRTVRGWVAVTPGPGGTKLVRTLDCGGVRGDRRHAVTAEELSGEVSRILGRKVGVEEGRWLSRFSDFARLARSFRSGRVFLAGDAAHVHFPVGGQGLSTGVLDALNLGWKLALVVRGEAGAGLLDTYERERRPVARRVIEHARAQLALMRPGSEFDALRGVFAGMLAAGGEDASYLGDVISGQDTVLPEATGRPSPVAGTFLRNVVLVTREGESDVIGLLKAGRPLLLLFGEKGDAYREEARDWQGVVRVVDVEPTREVPHEALLVRPDGYVAWAPGGESLAVALSVYFASGARVRWS